MRVMLLCLLALVATAARADDAALKTLGIDTVRELGANKYFALAGVLVALAGKTG